MISRLRRLPLVLILSLACVLVSKGFAQIGQHFGSQVTAVTATGAQNYTALASDSAGNLYVLDQTNGALYKETLSGGTYTQSTILSSGLLSPMGVAVDAAGNLYITDHLKDWVLKETLSGGIYTQSVIFQNSGGNFGNPYGIAVDGNGNVYVVALNSGVASVFKFTPSGSSYSKSTLPLTGLQAPAGLAVDSANNLYVVDTNYPRVVKETFSGNSITQSIVVDDSTFNWLDQSSAVAVDQSGNVFVTNGGPFGSDADTVVEALPIGGTYHYRLFGAGFGYGNGNIYVPTAVAADAQGNVFIATGTVAQYTIQKVSTPSTDFGSVNLGSSSAVLSMPFEFSASTTAPQTGAAVSFGASGEFVDVGTGTCDTAPSGTTYGPGSGCTVNVKFTPKFAGVREGAAQVVNTSGVVIAEGYITGTGIGAQVAFSPGTQTTVGTGFTSPASVAVDGNGVVYILDSSTNTLSSETPSGGAYTQGSVPYTVYTPTSNRGLAVDGAGDIYLNDPQNNFIVQLAYIPGSGYSQNNVASSQLGDSLTGAQGIATDGGGNVYIADTGNNRVVEEIYSSGSSFDQPVSWHIVVATGLNQPKGVAADSAGNVYVADTGNNRILKETATGGGSYTQSVVVSSGLNGPQAVLVDGVGNLYIADTGNSRVLKETLSGGTYTQSTVAATGLSSPEGLALDASGNLYIADPANKDVLKLAMGSAPTLTFAATSLGSTSSDSPQTVTIENNGNAALAFPIPATGNDPGITTNFTLRSTGSSACPLLSPSSGSPGTLAVGAACTLPISFSPTNAAITSGSLVLTDNNLGVAAAQQTIPLSGTGNSSATTTTTLAQTLPASGNSTFGQSVTATATVALQSGTSTPTGSVVFTVDGTAEPSVLLSGAGTAAITLPSLTAGAHSISAAYTATGNFANSATASPLSVTVNKATPTITWATPAAIAYGTALGAAQLNATGSVAGALVYTPAAGSTPAAGVQTLSVTLMPTDTTDYTTATQTVSLTVNKPTLTLTANNATRVYGAANPVFSGTVTGQQNGDVFTESFATTATASSPTGTYPIVPSVTGANLGNYTVVQQNGILTVGKAVAAVAVASSANPIFVQNPVILTATISSATGTPTGSVVFEDGTTVLGNGTVAAGVATFTTSSLGVGAHTITAVYSGDGDFNPATSAAITQTIEDFTFNVSSSGGTVSQTVLPGGTATYTLIVSPSGASVFPGAINFSISGLPTGATASFAPPSIAAGAGSTTVILTIKVPQQVGTYVLPARPGAAPSSTSQVSRAQVFPAPAGRFFGSIVLGILLLPFAGRIRPASKRLRRLSSVLLLLLGGVGAIAALSGCGSQGFYSPAQTSTLTVTATSGPLSRTTALTLTVK